MLAWTLDRCDGIALPADVELWLPIAIGLTVGSNHVVEFGPSSLDAEHKAQLIADAKGIEVHDSGFVLVNAMTLSPMPDYRLVAREISNESHAFELRRAELLCMRLIDLIHLADVRGVKHEGMTPIDAIKSILTAEAFTEGASRVLDVPASPEPTPTPALEEEDAAPEEE